MMKSFAVIAMATAVLATACAALSVSKLAAEPISGVESLTDPWQTQRQPYNMADVQARFQDRDYDGALNLLEEIVRDNADMSPAQFIMAQLYSKAGMNAEARVALEKAAVEAPDDPEVYLLLARVAIRDRDLPKAELLYRKAMTLVAAFNKSAKRKAWMEPQIRSGLASVAEVRKDWPAAQKTLEQWLQQDPNNTAAAQRLAHCLFQQKNVKGALERLRAAAKADAELLTPEAILAMFYHKSGDRENAKKWMTAALVAAPKDLNTHLIASQWALETGQLYEAQKQAIAALRLSPTSLNAKLLQAMIANYERNYEAAEMFFESALKQTPSNLFITNNLALSLAEQNDDAKKQRALELAEANAKLYPEVAEVLSTYGMVLYRLGRLADAERALRDSAALKDPSVDTAYIMACIAVEQGRKAEARQLLENALKNTSLCMFRHEAEELLKKLQ